MTPTAAISFEPEYIEGLRHIFEERIVFNRTLGLKLHDIQALQATARLEMRPELVGHNSYHRLHGGVISAALDALGGIAVLAATGARHMDTSVEHRLQHFTKLGTIDLRVEYHRPAIGECFSLRAEVLRVGSRVASTRMEFLAADGKLLSTGAAAYIIS